MNGQKDVLKELDARIGHLEDHTHDKIELTNFATQGRFILTGSKYTTSSYY